MRHYQARQRNTDGRWDYTCGYTPVGYCHEFKDPVDDNPLNLHWPQDQIDAVRNNKHKYHTDGHATEEEACNCYKQYLLDQRFRVNKLRDQMNRCEVCKEFSQYYAEVGNYRLHFVCEKHANREDVGKLVEIGESWES